MIKIIIIPLEYRQKLNSAKKIDQNQNPALIQLLIHPEMAICIILFQLIYFSQPSKS